MEQRPNILYIMADQMQAQITPMYDQESPIKMPNLQKLSEEGVTFDSAYTNSPLCAPSRFSMVSGRLPSKIGAWDNAAQIASDIPTYAHFLRRQGYHTALSGKQHFIGADQLHGYEQRLTSDIYPADFGWTVDWRYPEVRADWYHNMSSVEQAGPCYTSNQLDYDEEVVYQAHKYIWKRARMHRDQPFCLTVSMTHPHDPYTARQEYWDRYEDVDIPLPKNKIPQEKQDPHSKRLLQVVDLVNRDLAPEDIKRARRAYFANCSYVDDKVGILLDALKKSGLMDNTIIVFSGDHGDYLGERGLWYKMGFHEGPSRVPMIFHYPKLWTPKRVKQAVSTMDLTPTFVAMLGGEIDPFLSMEGRSMVKHLLGQGGHDEVIGEYYGEGTISPLFMIRRGPYKFIYCDTDPSQLYNLEDDPEEMTNLCQSADKEIIQLVNAFHDEIALRWDIESLRKEVLESQAKRRFVAAALSIGEKTVWDHQPLFPAHKEFIRNGSEILDQAEELARFPPAPPTSLSAPLDQQR